MFKRKVQERLAQKPAGIVYPASVKSSYAVIRNLGERGVPVIAMNPATHPHLKSRWVTPLRSPHMVLEPDHFFDFLEEVSRHLPQGGVLYLMEDVYVYLAHVYRERIPPNIRFPFLSDTALDMSLNKQSMLQAAERAGVPIPWTRYPTSLRDLEGEQVPFPCLIKPLVSRFTPSRNPDVERFSTAFGGKCVGANSPDELNRLLQRAFDLDIPVCVQERLMAPNDRIFGVHLYANASQEILGVLTGRKIRQLPADFGVCTLSEAVRRPDAIPLAKALIEEIGYHGIAGIEFMEDPRTGELKLIEINPRGVHWMGLAPTAGLELPYLQYADLTGQPERQEQRDFTSKWWDGRRDFEYLERCRRGAPGYALSSIDWARRLLGATPSVLNWKDPVPGLVGMIPPAWGQAYLKLKQKVLAGSQPNKSRSQPLA